MHEILNLPSDLTGECATCDVPATATTPTICNPLDSTTTLTSSSLKHGECIKEEDEQNKVETSPAPQESKFFPPVN